MKNIDKNKEYFIFAFNKQEFPNNLINPESLHHKDLLFNHNSEEPELYKNNTKQKYSKNFIIETEIEKKKKLKSKHHQTESTWRNTDNIDFFDDFKGKTDVKQVKLFKLSQELQISKEYNYFVRNEEFEDYKIRPNLIKYYEPGENITILTSDSLFENANLILKLEENLNFSQNPEIVNTKVLYNINEYLNYPKDDQLWYIFHPIAKSAFGPLSTINIEDMYNTKVLNGQTEIRLIDCFEIKNKKPFAFFKMKEIEKQGFLNMIEVSQIIKKSKLNSKVNREVESIITGKEVLEDEFFNIKLN